MTVRFEGKATSGGGRAPSPQSGVNEARHHQKSGMDYSFGGYMKVNHGGGSFSMRQLRR